MARTPAYPGLAAVVPACPPGGAGGPGPGLPSVAVQPPSGGGLLLLCCYECVYRCVELWIREEKYFLMCV